MPYSPIKKLQSQLRKESNKIIKQFDYEAKTIYEKSINNTFEELYKEAYRMYDSLIDQYYEYKTKSYIRHGETLPGTGRGINLYRGQQIKYTPGFVPQLTIDFSGKDMEGYKNSSADEVLDMVMSGIRGVPEKGWWTTWHGSYDGKYFSVGGVDIHTAFRIFDDNFDYLSQHIFIEKLNTEKKSGKYAFFK